MLQLRDAASSEDADTGSEPTPAITWPSLRWLIGVAPWIGIVVLVAWLDGCAPVASDDSLSDPTPFPDYGDDDDAASDDDDGGLGGPYPAVLRPDVDEVGVSRLAPLWVDFSEEGVDFSIALTGPDGAEVPGRVQRVGAVRTLFVPDEPLVGESTYGVEVTWGDDDSLAWSFVTAPSRVPTGVAPDVTVSWDLATAAASSPPGAEAFLSQLPLALVTRLDGAPPSVLGATTTDEEPPAQDLCTPTFEPTATEPALWEDPLLATPDAVLRLSVDLSIVGFGIQILPLRDVRFAAELAAEDGLITGIAEGSFYGWIDAREVAVPGLCETLGGVAIECVPCEDGEEQCLVLALEGIGGAVLDLDIEPRTAGEVKADPSCAPQGEGSR